MYIEYVKHIHNSHGRLHLELISFEAFNQQKGALRDMIGCLCLFTDTSTGSWSGAYFSGAKASRTSINPRVHNRERTNEQASFLVAARETTIRSYGPGKLLRFGRETERKRGREKERESDRKVKGGYRAPLPVSINVAGLFPDISRCCAKIYLPLACGTDIDRYRTRDARSNRVRESARGWTSSCRADFVVKKTEIRNAIERKRKKSEGKPYIGLVNHL